MKRHCSIQSTTNNGTISHIYIYIYADFFYFIFVRTLLHILFYFIFSPLIPYLQFILLSFTTNSCMQHPSSSWIIDLILKFTETNQINMATTVVASKLVVLPKKTASFNQPESPTDVQKKLELRNRQGLAGNLGFSSRKAVVSPRAVSTDAPAEVILINN